MWWLSLIRNDYGNCCIFSSCFRLLERLPAKNMAAQLRLLADYFVYEMSNCTNQQLVNAVCHFVTGVGNYRGSFWFFLEYFQICI